MVIERLTNALPVPCLASGYRAMVWLGRRSLWTEDLLDREWRQPFCDSCCCYQRFEMKRGRIIWAAGWSGKQELYEVNWGPLLRCFDSGQRIPCMSR